MARIQEDAQIQSNRRLQGDYYQVDICAPGIAAATQPGQFAHVQLPRFEHRVLRRPFSIYDVDPATGRLSIIYKIVGEGTAHFATLGKGTALNLLGPLGVGYSSAPADSQPIVVAGGYGCAATYLFAKRSATPPLVLIGGRSAGDILLQQEFADLGCEVRVSTNDGSQGYHGLVTALLEQALDESQAPFVVSCGPNPMLYAVARILAERGLDGEVSLDHAMCCGVGACFACVVKMKADNADGWEYVRTCLHGPVFRASTVHWEE
jgi:dihydroorotate dehydrogenase electron transfer subunit